MYSYPYTRSVPLIWTIFHEQNYRPRRQALLRSGLRRKADRPVSKASDIPILRGHFLREAVGNAAPHLKYHKGGYTWGRNVLSALVWGTKLYLCFGLEVLRFWPWIWLRSQISTLLGTYSNSDSEFGSMKKWIRNSYRGVMIPSRDLDPELGS